MATNYDRIKEMNMSEMATVFYLFMRPMFDVLECNQEQRDEAKQQIKAFLEAEAK